MTNSENKKRPELTSSARDKYLKSGGSACPFCESNCIEGDGMDVDGPTGTSNCRCGKCGEEWIDTYELSNIEQTEELT